jgi:hypothetical protein
MTTEEEVGGTLSEAIATQRGWLVDLKLNAPDRVRGRARAMHATERALAGADGPLLGSYVRAIRIADCSTVAFTLIQHDVQQIALRLSYGLR